MTDDVRLEVIGRAGVITLARPKALNARLAARRVDLLARAYADARDEAALETGLPETAFPATCPYEWATVMGRAHVAPGRDPSSA